MTHARTGLGLDESCRLTLDHVGALVRVWTSASGVAYVNRQWRDLTGSAVEANTGDGWLQFVHADDRAALATPSPAGIIRSYRLVTPDGAPVTILESCAAWMGEDGTVLGLIHTGTLQAPSQPSATSMAKWAHDLRGPLNAILGWSDLLSTGDAAADVLERGLKAIASNARQQALIIKRMTE
jgi:hypothetical protein